MQFIISLIILIVFISSYNLDSDLSRLTNSFLSNDEQKNKIINTFNSSSKMKNLFFIAGYEGFKNILSVHGFSLFIYAINACIIFPLLLIFIIYLLLNFIWIYITSKIRRDYKYNFIRQFGKWGFIISIGIFLISMLIGLGIIISSKYDFSDQFSNDWFSNFKSKNINSDFVSHTSVLLYITNISDFIFHTNKSNTINELSSLHTTIQYSDLSFIVTYFGLYIPIVFFVSIFFLSIFIACFLSKRNDNVTSSLSNWLGNVRIDSMKEFRGMFFKSIYFWVLSIVALVAMISPVLLCSSYSGYEITLCTITVIAFLITFIPLLICYIRTKCMFSTSFNTYMFIMMNLHLLFTIYVQILGYTLIRGSTIIPFQIFIFQIILIYTIQITTFVLFIRSDK
ncbi:motility-associated protein Scm1 [Spiroplasma endosymbiont of Aspidapion aeneum]|uniref:motility-associated protein Scm1 n=1 Tax=Spiroplasma endosymbiont of Aspidapion aeneum TaxID=3066276 RepID=UPI00313CE33D